MSCDLYLDKYKGLKSELETVKKLKAELEGKLSSTESQLHSIQDNNQKMINTLQSQVNELKNNKVSLVCTWPLVFSWDS